MLVIPLLGEKYEADMISQSRISITQLDLSRSQSLQDFKDIRNIQINYKSSDCLILLKDHLYTQLKTEQWINLSSVEQIGWFSQGKHNIKIQLYSKIEPGTIERLIKQNPNIRFSCFEFMRDQQLVLKQMNILAGGFGLCYYQFRKDYDRMFSTIDFVSTRWCLSRTSLDPKNDYVLILHLLLLDRGDHNDLLKELSSKDQDYKSVYRLLLSSFYYFTTNNFTTEGYFAMLDEEFSKDKSTQQIAEQFQILYKEYVRKGLEVRNLNPLTSAVRMFIDLAKNEIPELHRVLSSNIPLSKSALFLLGMYHTSAHLDKQFELGNVIPAFVEFLSKSVEEITINAEDIEIQFRKDVIETSEIKKYEYLTNYITAIKKSRDLDADIALLTKVQEKDLRDSEMRFIEREIQEIDRKINKEEIVLQINDTNRTLADDLKNKEIQNQELNTNINALRLGKEEVENELSLKSKKIVELSSNIRDKESDIHQKENAIVNYKKEIEERRARISDLESTVREKNIDIDNHKELYGKLNKQYNDLKESYSELEQNQTILIETNQKYIDKYYQWRYWYLRLFNKKKYEEQKKNEFEQIRKLLL